MKIAILYLILQIITIRYAFSEKQPISSKIDPSSRVWECDCLKAILQPIVENSMSSGSNLLGTDSSL